MTARSAREANAPGVECEIWWCPSHWRPQALVPQLLRDHADDPHLIFELLMLGHGQLLSAARARWARESQAILDALERGGNKSRIAARKKLPCEGDEK